MICIYEKTTSDFNNNGLGTLEPIECTFKPVINGVWSLEMTLPYDAEGKSQLIANDRILKVTDIDCISEQTAQYQLFRIYDFKKEDNFVSVTAYPIGLDARFDTFVDSVKMNYKTASQAIAQMDGLSSKYTVSGSGYDATVKSAEYANANLISILNGENSFVQVWDGEICYDNYNIRVNHRLGSSSNPLDVRYGKNITGMSYDMDASNIITQLYPKSKDNYPLNINNRNYVNASNFADYPIPHMYYIQAPFNLVQLSDDGSEEYLMSADVFDHIKTLTAEWLNKALSQDEIYGGLLKEIELDWINNNYDLTMIHDGVQGIVEYLWRKLIGSSHANITHGAVQSLIYNAMKAGFDDVLKNSDSGYYVGSTSKKLMDTGFGTQFYSYEWDVAGQYRVTPDGEGYVWVYASSKWNQLDINGETTGATDKTKWKWYKVKGKTYKRYGNKKKNRYLKSQWWKINDVWYWFDSNGKSIKGSALNSMYYEYFEDAEIMLDGVQQTIYDILSDVCSNSESQLVGLLNNQMEQYCLNLFENEKLSYPTVKLDINMVDLSQTTEYKDFQSLERIHLGDSVKVFNPRLGIESTVRVIGLTYDVLRKMNTEIQIGVTETSVINLLNNIGKGSDEVRYVAGDGITIENNTISVIPPTKPYLEDVILNGESVVRNHKAYIDLDEMGIDESIDVLYGEDVPDDETDGEDKDFYFELSEGSGHVINENDYEAYTDATHPISITRFTRVSDTEYNFNITGTPSNDGNGENIFINLTGLVEGEQYTITFDAQYSSGTTFPYYPEYDTIADIISGTGTSLVSEVLQSDTQKHSHTLTFTASAVNKLHYFLSSKDNVSTTLSITDLIIDGDIQFVGEIEEFYNKHQSKWLKYNRVKEVKVDGTSVVTDDIANINTMIGATSESDGTKGLVPQPTIADREKYLRGDGTWQDAQGASAVSDLTDVELTNLADKEILEYDAVAEKWKNVANSGGGGTSAGVSKIETLRGRTYTEKRQSNVTPFSLLGNILTSTASSQTNSVANIQSVQKIDVTSIDYFIITVFSLKGIANPYYPYIWLDDSDHSNDDYPTVSSKMQFTSTVNNYTVYVWDVSALTGEKYFGICTGVHTEFILSVEQSGTPQVVLQPIIYSEEERKVGVWIDNKPLYQKTIHVATNIPSANGYSRFYISDYISNYELIVDMNAFIVVDSKATILPYVITGQLSTYSTGFAMGGNEVYISRGSGGGIAGETYVTFYYTKTTDTAGSGSYNTLGVPTVHIDDTEQVIGTYFGKPYYQKAFNKNFTITSTNRTWYTLITSSELRALNADKIMINTDDSYVEDARSIYGINYSSIVGTAGGLVGGVYDKESDVVQLCIAGLSSSTVNAKLVIRYTKTTD